MYQTISMDQHTEALGTLPRGGDESTRLPHDEITSPGMGETTRIPGAVASRLGRLERALGQQRRFASDASHELRSPIAGLRARLEEARLYPDDTHLTDLIEQVLSDVNRLESIVSELLLLSRVEAAGDATGNGGRKLETIDLADLVTSEIRHRTDRLPTRRRLAPGVSVTGARGELIRVLTNLLDNAQRHARREVTVEARRGGDHAELIVSDDGDGVAMADRERIFKRFVRLDASRERDRGGTGLGLAISREIAHAHHGTLEVGETPRGGARFVLRLPLSSGDTG